MTRNDVFKIIAEVYSCEPEYLWDGETHAVFRHPGSNKWFAIIMDVKKKSLHLKDEDFDGEEIEDIMNVKANPFYIEDLLHEGAFLPAYHMNKKYWVSIRLGMVTEEAIRKLLNGSWDLVKPKTRKHN